MNKKYFRDQGIFHITNVCNLSCSNCDVYSDRNFKGHSSWNKFSNFYQEWTKKIHLDSINVFGGEPFSNPDLYNWIVGLKETFPDAKTFSISTNGTYLKKNIKLAREIINNDFWLDVSIHDPSFKEGIEHSIEEILSNNKIKKVKIADTIEYFIGEKKVVRMWNATVFRLNSTFKVENKTTFFRRSDPIAAHTYCMESCAPPNVVFNKGLLYKCNLTSISSDLISQFSVEEHGALLLNSYRPADPFDTDENLDLFFQNLNNPISACQLCPEREVIVPIWPMSKKRIKYN